MLRCVTAAGNQHRAPPEWRPVPPATALRNRLRCCSAFPKRPQLSHHHFAQPAVCGVRCRCVPCQITKIGTGGSSRAGLGIPVALAASS